jgi:probable phosphoglycerate mutase
MSRRLLLARHGQTAWNREGRVQGHSDPPLDAIGERQAAALARQAAELWEPALVVSSDLRRAHQTAVVVADAARCPLQLRPDLREVDVGRWEGRLRAEVRNEEPDRFAAWRQGRCPAPGASETIADAGARVRAALAAISRSGPDEGPVVVIGHGLAMQHALGLLTGEPAPHLANGEWVAVTIGDDVASEQSADAAPSLG